MFIAYYLHMPIRILPNHIINKLKAGEIVERPASICKELIENALDAHASHIVVSILWWWKDRIQVEDDWMWIAQDDIPLTLTRYATSKIADESDLYSLSTYWFRWEALASIAEVSQVTIMTKTSQDMVATKLSNATWAVSIVPVPVAGKQGTTLIIENLFYNVPVRQKFLKSSQTEYFYCYDVFLGYALMHWDKHRVLQKDMKTIYDLPICTDFIERFRQLFKDEWVDHIRILDFDNNALRMYWVFSDAALSFGSPEHIKMYVNQRPVQDRVLKKAIMQAYDRQLAGGLYPLAFLFVDIASDAVDVNVHPRKQEVRFADPWSMYQCVLQAVRQALWDQKIMQVDETQLQQLASASFTHHSLHAPATDAFVWAWSRLPFTYEPQISLTSYDTDDRLITFADENASMPLQRRIIWQLWDMYVLLEDNDFLYVVDQHALAERIAYERMRTYSADHTSSHQLLQPVSIATSPAFPIEQYETTLSDLWFDIAQLSANQIVIYNIPTFFADYADDLEYIVRMIMTLNDATFEKISDQLYAEKACKASIKAWQRLHPQEMQSLIKQWLETIPWMFVCQHGRPFMWRFDKGDMDKLFHR
jgi:DNA mismatch repair protein MutL